MFLASRASNATTSSRSNELSLVPAFQGRDYSSISLFFVAPATNDIFQSSLTRRNPDCACDPALKRRAKLMLTLRVASFRHLVRHLLRHLHHFLPAGIVGAHLGREIVAELA